MSGDARRFVGTLAEENASFWRDRDVRLDPNAPPARLVALGEDPDGYRPLSEWEALFDWLCACRTRPTLEKLAMFQFAGETQSCEGFETLIALARDVDPETAELYRAEILPDEYRHAAIGRKALTLLADTPALQARARAACRELRGRTFAAYRAHRARTDRGA